MQRELYRELWTLRFQKMLQLEESSVQEYEVLLEEAQKIYEDHTELHNTFRQLISDEKMHAKLVRELLDIVEQQPD